MKKVKSFIVEEVLRKKVTAKCSSIEDGKMQIQSAYDYCDIVLDYDNHYKTTIYSESELEALDNVKVEYTYISKPLTFTEVFNKMDEEGYISEVIAIRDTEIHGDKNNYTFVDLLNEKLCDIRLYDLQYKMLSVIPEKSIILYKVSGRCFDSLVSLKKKSS